MKVLWVVNNPLPNIAVDIGMPPRVFEGWLVGLSNLIKNGQGIELIIACPQNTNSKIISGKVDNIEYYAYPRKKASSEYDMGLHKYFEIIISETKPDVIHIMGTEYPHSFSAIIASDKVKMLEHTVVSIQGLVSVYAQHYVAGIPFYVQKNHTIREMLKGGSISKEKTGYEKRGVYEIKTLTMCKHVIGRTDWDRACSYFINPLAEYHYNNETLRPAFYERNWRLEYCEKNSIFVSQGNKTIKGFHFVLEAIKLVKQTYRDVKVYLAGSQYYKAKERLPKWKRTSYENYIFDLMEKYDLIENVVFCGALDEIAMRDQFLKANVFVSASTIENSPNSVGEAMVLGVPTITSDVGGVKNLLTHGEEGLIYPMDEPYMLAFYIIKIFSDNCFAEKISRNAQCKAQHTHNRILNAERLIEIYNEIR